MFCIVGYCHVWCGNVRIIFIGGFKMASFEGKVSKMGRKRMVNVPAKQVGFKVGDAVRVRKK